MSGTKKGFGIMLHEYINLAVDQEQTTKSTYKNNFRS